MTFPKHCSTVLLALLLPVVCWSSSLSFTTGAGLAMAAPSPVPITMSRAQTFPTRDPFLLALWTVESSNGQDCGTGNAGERGCWQILPSTARLEGCRAWEVDGSAGAECATRWLERGKRTCRRWDEYAAARWYNRGRCMGPKTKPGAYEQQVVKAWLAWLMRMERT